MCALRALQVPLAAQSQSDTLDSDTLAGYLGGVIDEMSQCEWEYTFVTVRRKKVLCIEDTHG